MTAFTVFGVTRTRASRLAHSALQERYAEHDERNVMIEEYMDQETQYQIENSEPLKVSPLFSAPQFCQDWIDLAYKKYPIEYYRLLIKQHVPKLNAAGFEITRKKSTKPLMTWETYAKQN